MTKPIERFELRFNPFEPSASGAPMEEKLWLPSSWRLSLTELLNLIGSGEGVKALPLIGEYGSGKTYVLQWLNREELPGRRIQAYYFDNPGVQFYDLANSLLRQIGRKDFAKLIWEFVGTNVSYQKSLFARGFEEYLRSLAGSKQSLVNILPPLQEAISKAKITTDEEIAYRLARLVAETGKKPYFEYRDFVAGRKEALVAEGEEAPYFGAILKVLRLASGTNAVGFLIDEFEEVSLQKRLSRREAHGYLATLKRLINLTRNQNFWLFVAMTPQAEEVTKQLEPALWDRFSASGDYRFELPPLSQEEANELVKTRLDFARPKDMTVSSELFPFSDDFDKHMKLSTTSSPRRMIKVCFFAVSNALEKPDIELPFTAEYVRSIEQNVYPPEDSGAKKSE